MPNYGNRGKSLEYAINKLFERYASRGIHCQKNHPEQLYSGEIVKKHGFDFQILYRGKFYAFDAKECKQARWPLDVDNMVGGAKPLRDAIARALHIDDAESENLEWIYTQEKGTGMKVKVEVMEAK